MERWIFGYGSLIWRPAFPHAERRPARAHGWVRRFWQASSDHRGTVESPGRVVTLAPEPGAVCQGVAYRVDDAQLEGALRILDVRESGGYQRHRIPLWIAVPEGSQREVWGWIYVAAPGNPSYVGPAPLEEVARIVAAARGPSGANVEYVRELARALRELGASDPEVFALEQLLESADDAAEAGRR